MRSQRKKNHCEIVPYNGKPYNHFGDYLFNKYGYRVLKLPVNAGLSCPNRDASLDGTGCIFCSEDGSSAPTINGIESLQGQMANAVKSFKRSPQKTGYIAYFQSFTNTHAPVHILRELYDRAVSFPDIMGLMIGTRPDCVDDEVLDCIASYQKENFELWIELGVQTMKNESLSFLRRRHASEDSVSALKRTQKRGIPVCAHVILGIPGETWHDMMETAKTLAFLDIAGVKLHQLHVIKNTPLEAMYRRGEIPLISREKYVSTACDFIERMHPDTIIHRLFADHSETSLVAPLWGIHKGTVLKLISEEFISRGTCQGFLYDHVTGETL